MTRMKAVRAAFLAFLRVRPWDIRTRPRWHQPQSQPHSEKCRSQRLGHSLCVEFAARCSDDVMALCGEANNRSVALLGADFC